MITNQVLRFGINLILLLHIFAILFTVRSAKSSWQQTKIGSNDLKGVFSLEYNATFGSRTFQYIHNQKDDRNPEKHLYTTSIAHLQLSDEDKATVEIPNVTYSKTGLSTYIPIKRLALTLPVSDTQKRNLVYLTVGISILMILYSFFIFLQLRRLIKSVISKDPFNDKNIRILYSIGILVIVVPLLKYAIESMELRWISKLYDFPGYSISSDISFQVSIFGVGILILGIAEIFRQGILIKKEHELTI
jgi:hypothetical protein